MFQYREVEILGRLSLSNNQARMFHEELLKIEASGKPLDAEVVVEAASDPNSPMHDLFDWDDSSAGHKFRLMQARKYVKEVQVKVEFVSKMEHTVNDQQTALVTSDDQSVAKPESKVVTIPAWNHSKDVSKEYKITDMKPGAYNHYSHALGNRDEAEMVIVSAWRELKRWYDRYKEKSVAYGQRMAHFQQVLVEIEELERRMNEENEAAAAVQR